MKILNLGCGSSFYGTDRVDQFETKATTQVFNVELFIPYGAVTFDKVYSRNLLEHLKNPGYHLAECHRVLKHGGEIEVITDNAQCYRYYLFGTHTGRYEKKHIGDHHYSLFTKQHLINHFEAAGFKDIKVEGTRTDTLGKWLDLFTWVPPRWRVTAKK